ncbi:histidine triad nucleotide-binding protein [Helicovermis profundi]|uniref:HIT domain-containing protein n=1 Tax=Helicovermis profundi TaxID=3065157 RepID=A0AAU9E5E2_9FIRM|nr:HIT domain-containing protein [Clostridia bacterium S502]
MSDCIFCKIVNGEIPSKKAYEDDKILAFYDLNPVAPVHILIVPKIHINSIVDLDSKSIEYVTYIMTKIKDLAKELGVDESGFRLVTNVGDDGGQTVEHLHFHLVGGRPLEWPPG